MKKDFDQWNTKKKECDEKTHRVFYREREIWWCALGLNIGNEQDGKDECFQRPVLVIRGFSKETCLIVPLTTSKNLSTFRISIGLVNNTQAAVILSQIKVIDVKRLINRIGKVDKDLFQGIKKSLRDLL